jgi:hypothetical protein
METLQNTSLNLRLSALENIKKYCDYSGENFNQVKNDLINEADKFNLKKPIDFYTDFYNLSVSLLQYIK